MRIIPDIKATFGETHFLGYSEKKRFDKTINKRTDEVEYYICRVASSYLEEQIEVAVPPTADIHEIKFNQKVILKDVVIDPYARGSAGSSFAEVVLRCSAEAIQTELPDKGAPPKSDGRKPNMK